MNNTFKTGVNIEWIEARTNGAEKLNLVLASNDLPDVIFSSNMTPEFQVMYGSQGILVPIEDLLTENMYFFKDVLDSDPEILNKYRMADGNVYCVPKVMGAYEITYEQFALINKVWLDNLGLEMPKTIEELKEVLIAFKEQDPNGNGIADEIPLLGYNDDGSPGKVWAFLMFPFIYHDGQYSTLVVKDGEEVYPAFTQDAWREGLRYQADLLNNGLIDPESFNIRYELAGENGERERLLHAVQTADIIAPTLTEGQLLTGCTKIGDVLQALHQLGPRVVALTLDKNGAVFSMDGLVAWSPGIAVDAIDPTGAGDTLAAALCVGLREGMPLRELAAFCNCAGALEVTRRGAIGMALPSREEVDALMQTEVCRVEVHSINDLQK